MATSYAKHGFNNLTYARLLEYTASTALTLTLIHGYVAKLLPGWASGRNMFITLRDAAGNLEICKITDIQGDNLTVARGQDGTIARNWPAGTLVAQRSVADSLGRFNQKGEFKTVSYNPNSVLTADYPNEKVYQSGDSCHRRWWIHSDSNKWRLVAGIKCSDEYWSGGYLYATQQLFCFGSRADGKETDQYDPNNDMWSAKTDRASERFNAAAASPGGSDGINVFGGGADYWADSVQDNALWGTGLSYSTKTDMPAPPRQAHMAVGSYGDYAYCFGGRNFLTSTTLSDNDQYSEAGDSWIGKQAVPSPARMAAAAGHPYLGEYYYTGGDVTNFDMGTATGDHDEYNPSGDSWTGKTDLSPVRAQYAGAVDLDYFYTAYGRDNISASKDLDYFYPTGNTWTALADAIDLSQYGVFASGHDSSGGATYYVGADTALSGSEETREYFFGWSLKTNALSKKGYNTMAQSLSFSPLA